LCEQTNPKYWDDEDAETVDDAYGDDWEKVAAFAYDNVEYSMVKILEPVLILAKEDPVSRLVKQKLDVLDGCPRSGRRVIS
jgi:hypothetical protein